MALGTTGTMAGVVDAQERRASVEDPEKHTAGDSRRPSRIDKKDDYDTDASSGVSIGAQIEMEKENAIQYRTCGWKKVCEPDEMIVANGQTSCLLFSEYICLAIMSFPYS
jgi:hypothetical protein